MNLFSAVTSVLLTSLALFLKCKPGKGKSKTGLMAKVLIYFLNCVLIRFLNVKCKCYISVCCTARTGLGVFDLINV